MVRALAFVIFAFLTASWVVNIASGPSGTGVISPSALPPIATSTAITFDATGTVDYSSNNAGTQIPYFFYQTASGATASKILLFCNAPAGHYEGTVHVEGQVEDESVCANSIVPA